MKKRWFCVSVILAVILLLLLWNCRARVEKVMVALRNNQYEMFIVYDTNEDYFKGRESFLRSRRDLYFIDVAISQKTTRYDRVQLRRSDNFDAEIPHSGYVDVRINGDDMKLVIHLIGQNSKQLPFNGTYSLKRIQDSCGIEYSTESK